MAKKFGFEKFSLKTLKFSNFIIEIHDSPASLAINSIDNPTFRIIEFFI